MHLIEHAPSAARLASPHRILRSPSDTPQHSFNLHGNARGQMCSSSHSEAVLADVRPSDESFGSRLYRSSEDGRLKAPRRGPSISHVLSAPRISQTTAREFKCRGDVYPGYIACPPRLQPFTLTWALSPTSDILNSILSEKRRPPQVGPFPLGQSCQHCACTRHVTAGIQGTCEPG